jgi:hypothetical protein
VFKPSAGSTREWPGWVEVQFAESDGTTVSIVEKAPVVDHDDRVVPGVRFPVDVEIPDNLRLFALCSSACLRLSVRPPVHAG